MGKFMDGTVFPQLPLPETSYLASWQYLTFAFLLGHGLASLTMLVYCTAAHFGKHAVYRSEFIIVVVVISVSWQISHAVYIFIDGEPWLGWLVSLLGSLLAFVTVQSQVQVLLAFSVLDVSLRSWKPRRLTKFWNYFFVLQISGYVVRIPYFGTPSPPILFWYQQGLVFLFFGTVLVYETIQNVTMYRIIHRYTSTIDKLKSGARLVVYTREDKATDKFVTETRIETLHTDGDEWHAKPGLASDPSKTKKPFPANPSTVPRIKFETTALGAQLDQRNLRSLHHLRILIAFCILSDSVGMLLYLWTDVFTYDMVYAVFAPISGTILTFHVILVALIYQTIARLVHQITSN
ncbi:hypothetical protein HDU91_006879 [Kappamyces sp. JEL0680]|nr:hypothetical protein HDU91_006879 [Kappamyces sp. JEL0680]